MKNKIPLISVIVILFLVVCSAAIVLTGLGSWFWLTLSEPVNSRPVTRTQVELAQTTSTATLVAATVAPLLSPPSPTVTATPFATSVSTPEPTTTILMATPTVTAEPLPTVTPNEIARVRGFALPEGSVNSVTQEGVATQLVIPKINVDAPVVLAPIRNGTWDVEFLGQDLVGHLEGTAPPGSTSNIVLAAHVTVAYNVYGPFAGLSLLTPGDDIYVYNQEQKFHYQVVDYQLVDRSNVEVTYPSDKSEITLITCNRWSKEEQRYMERLVVKGRLITP